MFKVYFRNNKGQIDNAHIEAMTLLDAIKLAVSLYGDKYIKTVRYL